MRPRKRTRRLRPWIRGTCGLAGCRRRARLRRPFFRGRSNSPAGGSGRCGGKNSLPAAIRFLSAANAHLQRGQPGPAAAAAEKALQLSTAHGRAISGGTDLRRDRQRRQSTSVGRRARQSTAPADDARIYGKIIEAQIALKKKDPHQAIKILTDANNVLDTWLGHFNLGRAYLEAGDLVQADSEFDLCITRRGEALTVMEEGPSYGIFPIVYYYQGRVREELKTANFADWYRDTSRSAANPKTTRSSPKSASAQGTDTPPRGPRTIPFPLLPRRSIRIGPPLQPWAFFIEKGAVHRFEYSSSSVQAWPVAQRPALFLF